MRMEKAISLANLAYLHMPPINDIPIIMYAMTLACQLRDPMQQLTAILSHTLDTISPLTEADLVLQEVPEEVIEAIKQVRDVRLYGGEKHMVALREHPLAAAVARVYMDEVLRDSEVPNSEKAIIAEELRMLNMGLADILIDQCEHVAVSNSIGRHSHDLDGFISRYETMLGISLSISQKEVLSFAMQKPMYIISGAQGSGLLQTVHALVLAMKTFSPGRSIRVISGSGHPSEVKVLTDKAKGKWQVETLPLARPIEEEEWVIVYHASALSEPQAKNAFLHLPSTSRLYFIEHVDHAEKLASELPGWTSPLYTYLRQHNMMLMLEPLSQEGVDESCEDASVKPRDMAIVEAAKFAQGIGSNERYLLYPITNIPDFATDYQARYGVKLRNPQLDAIEMMIAERVSVLMGEVHSGVAETVKALVGFSQMENPHANIVLYEADHASPYLANRIGINPTKVKDGPAPILEFKEKADLVLIYEPDQWTLSCLMYLLELIDAEPGAHSRIVFVGDSDSETLLELTKRLPNTRLRRR